MEKNWIQAFDEAMAMDTSFIEAQRISPAELSAIATEDLRHGYLYLNVHGVSDGAIRHIVQPVEALWEEWKKLREAFSIAFEPCKEHIVSIEAAQEELEALKDIRAEKLNQLEENFKTSEAYSQASEFHQRAREGYMFLARKYHRQPIMFAKKPFYWLLLAALWCGDGFLNIQIFAPFRSSWIFSFVFPLILSSMLVFSCHVGGEIIKQYTARFKTAVLSRQKLESFLWLSAVIIALGFVLGSIGIFCSETVIKEAFASSFWHNSIIAMAMNFGSWLLGWAIAYYAHDADPGYVDIMLRCDMWWKTLKELKSRHAARRKQIVEQFAREERLKIREFEQLKQKFEQEWTMWEAIEAHSDLVKEQLYTLLTDTLERYRDVIVNRTMLLNPVPRFHLTEKEIQPYDFKQLSFSATDIISLR